MFDWSFGSSIPTFSLFGNNAAPSGAAAGAPGVAPGAKGAPWWETILNLGIKGWGQWQQYDLANEQVAKGQYPSGPQAFLGTAQSSLTNLIPVIVLLGVIFVFFRLFTGGRKH